MTDEQLQNAIRQLPEGERFKKIYRAIEGDLRIVSIDSSGSEKRYRCTVNEDGTVTIAEF